MEEIMDRRDFLKSLGLGAPALTFPFTKAVRGDLAPPEKLPNIVIIMADDMGLGDPGCYNPGSLIPTPHMDRIATEGVKFTDAHSAAALCSPTRYSLLTGRYPWRTRLKKGVMMPYWLPLIEPSRMTIASLLRSRGYGTAYIGKWHLGLEWTTKDGSKAEEFYSREQSRQTDETLQWRVDFSRPIGGGPSRLGFDYFYGNAGCPSNDPPYVFIENDRPVAVPTQMSKDKWRGLPGETRDLAADNPPVVAALSALLDKNRRQGFSQPMRGKGSGSG
jgi:hypothetical protein